MRRSGQTRTANVVYDAGTHDGGDSVGRTAHANRQKLGRGGAQRNLGNALARAQECEADPEYRKRVFHPLSGERVVADSENAGGLRSLQLLPSSTDSTW